MFTYRRDNFFTLYRNCDDPADHVVMYVVILGHKRKNCFSVHEYYLYERWIRHKLLARNEYKFTMTYLQREAEMMHSRAYQ